VQALAVFSEERVVKLIDQPEPRVEDDRDVKVRIVEVGISATDRKVIEFKYGFPPGGSEFLIPGHEALGEVVEIGDAVTELKVGDLVVPLVRHPCPDQSCGPCRMNRADYCITGHFTERGIKEEHGFLQSFIVERPELLVRVPPELREVAVLTEPLAIAEKAVAQTSQILERLPWHPDSARPTPLRVQEDSRAVVVGAGTMGLLGAIRLRLAGYRVFVYALEPPESINARIAMEAGCEYISSQHAELPDLAREVGHIELVYESTGLSKLAFGVMKYLGQNGIFILTGIPAVREPISVDADKVLQNLVLLNQVVFGTVNAGYKDHEKALETLRISSQKWPAVLPSLISGRHRLDSLTELLQRQPPGTKHVIEL
jgi:glucose 1-dehydrogenase